MSDRQARFERRLAKRKEQQEKEKRNHMINAPNPANKRIRPDKRNKSS